MLKNCPICADEFNSTSRGQRTYCSAGCRKEAIRIRQSKIRESFRDAHGFGRTKMIDGGTLKLLWERCGGECEECGDSSKRLHIHHIDGVGRHHYDRGEIELVDNSLSNLMVMCISCHARLHNEQRWHCLTKEKI